MPPKPSGGPQGAPKNRPQTQSNTQKRPRAQADLPHHPAAARNPKRAKFYDARQIAVQPPSAALQSGELDLQAFLSARAFEVVALEDSMRATKAASTARAFQRVPRGLRRRTASHNPKRVPRRLRRKAMWEMKEDNTPLVVARRRKPTTTRGRIRLEMAKRAGVVAEKKRRRKERADKEKEKAENKGDDGVDAMDIDSGDKGPEKGTEKGTVITTRAPRPKIRRNALNEPPRVKSKFRRRQVSKTWLPTHVWHAKRARMTKPLSPLWRFAVPLTPNEKVYRPTHRAQGECGAVVWDMSYMSTIGLYGNAAGIERVLKKLGLDQESCWNDRGRRWRAGTRSWAGLLSRQVGTSQRRRDIGPATVLWDPLEPVGEAEGGGAPASDDPKKVLRQVFFRIHPSAFLELFNELRRLTRMETLKVWVEDLRFEIGSIELTGPASTEALLGILSPVDEKEKHAGVFTSLRGLTNPAALPQNAILSFSIQDPRLRHPPRTIEPPKSQDDTLLNLLASWPADETPQPSPLWDRDARHTASLLPSKKSIDRRKGVRTPGTHLKPTPADPPVPVVLLAQRTGTGAQSQGTWTLLAPWKCVQPLWYSLVHYRLSSGGNPRFAGLNEAQQVAFERGAPWFPADFVGTDAGVEWERGQRALRQEHWDKRPRGKRTAWEALELGAGRKGEVGNGLWCDFEYLFSKKGGPSEDKEIPVEDPMEVDNTESAERTNEKENQDTMKGKNEKDGKAKKDENEKTDGKAKKDEKEKKEGHQRGQKAKKETRLEDVTQLTKAQFNELSKKSNASQSPPPNAVVQVRLTLLTKGVAVPCARIYRLPRPTAPRPLPPDVLVPATDPSTETTPASTATTGITTPVPLPPDLREQWLALAPGTKQPKKPSPRTFFPPDADLSTRKRLLAESLVSPAAPLLVYPPPAPNQTDIGGHPLVPNAEDLIGFVTTGTFSLSEGKGVAIGSIAAEGVLGDLRGGGKGGMLCIVRNAGQNIGRLARWEII